MGVPRELQAEPGDLILPKWLALLEWAESLKIIPGPGVRIASGPNGTTVRALARRGWSHPFKVALSRDGVRVSAGLLDGGRVMMAGGFLDGKESDGVTRAKGFPVLELKEKPEDGAQTWVAIRRGEPVGGKPTAPEIVHVARLDGDKEQPLAVVTWRDGAPLQAFQVVFHNLQSALSSAPSSAGKVYFFPA
jgi:hypothetical protein